MNGKNISFDYLKDELEGLMVLKEKDGNVGFLEIVKYPRICFHVGLLVITS